MAMNLDAVDAVIDTHRMLTDYVRGRNMYVSAPFRATCRGWSRSPEATPVFVMAIGRSFGRKGRRGDVRMDLTGVTSGAVQLYVSCTGHGANIGIRFSDEHDVSDIRECVLRHFEGVVAS